MRNLSILAFFLAMVCIQARATDIIALFEEDNATEGKQYLAIAGDDTYTADGSVIIFGNKGDELTVRSWVVRPFMSLQNGKKGFGQDDFYALSISPKKDTYQVILTPTLGRKKTPIKLNYTRTEDKKVKKLAERAIAKLAADFAELDKVTDPSSITQFKKMLRLLARRVGRSTDSPWLEGGATFPLKSFNLQIEQDFSLTEISKALAEATIQDNAKDKISKALQINEWTSEKAALATEWEELQDHDSGDFPTLTFYRTTPREATSKALAAGAKKFVRYEVIKVTGFDCEGFYDEYYSTHWVLKDGSIFSYDPVRECD